MKPKIILFDLDGTLVDSVGDLTAAINGLLAELGRAPLQVDEVKPFVGDGVGRLVERCLAACPGGPFDLDAAVARYVALYEANPAARTLVYPGVGETLARLVGQGYRLVVCTNKPERVSRVLLGALGIEQCFVGVFGGDSLPWRKPDPQVIAAILTEFGVNPDEALFVGDSEVDAACAEAAEVPFAFVSYGYYRVPLSQIPRMATLNSFAELTGLIG